MNQVNGRLRVDTAGVQLRDGRILFAGWAWRWTLTSDLRAAAGVYVTAELTRWLTTMSDAVSPGGAIPDGELPPGITTIVMSTSRHTAAVEAAARDLTRIEGPVLARDALRMVEDEALALFGACIALGLADLAELPHDAAIGATALLEQPSGRATSLRQPHRLLRVLQEISFGNAPPFARRTELDLRAATRISSMAHDRSHRLLVRLMGGSSDRHVELRTACRFFLEAYGAADYGTAVMYGFLCLEGVLLDPNIKADVLARLSEAVAYRMGRSAAHRQRLRKMVKLAYEDRSRYVHTGRPVDGNENPSWPRLLAEVLEREISELEDQEGDR